MRFMDTARKLLFPLFWLLIAWFSYSITANTGSPKPSSSIKTEVTPVSSVITIDGHKVRTGKVVVQPGTHTVSASRNGFGAKSRSVNVKLNETVYVGIVLQPNSPDTSDWYNQHPSDQQLVDGIGSHQADYQNKAAIKAMPFFKQLPTQYGDGYGSLISVDPGSPVPPATLPAVYVTAPNPRDRQSVITYIKSRGYNPADMDMIFYGLQNPLRAQEGD